MNGLESYLTVFGGLLSALGGWECVRWLLNRNTEKRKAEAEADNLELETLRQQYDWLMEKHRELNEKVDGLYEYIHQLEERNISLLKKNNELEIALKVAQYNVCERPDDDCIRRLPTRQKCRLRMLLNGTYEQQDKAEPEKLEEDSDIKEQPKENEQCTSQN